MFSAAFEILYAGEGNSRKLSAMVMDARVVDLYFYVSVLWNGVSLIPCLHVDNGSFLASAKERQESPRDKVGRGGVDIQYFMEIIPKSVGSQHHSRALALELWKCKLAGNMD